jgi:hypothetical protein
MGASISYYGPIIIQFIAGVPYHGL